MEKYQYTEIFKLKTMLEDASIPFDWFDIDTTEPFSTFLSYQLCYPCFDTKKRWISVIEGPYSYGGADDKLEIMRTGTSDVTGWVSATDVFNRIKQNWEGRMKKKILKIDKDTLTFTEIEVEIEPAHDTEGPKTKEQILHDKLTAAMGRTADEFYQIYKNYKTAEAEFKEVFEPFKEKLLDLYKTDPDIPKNILIKGTKLTYVSSSIRNTIDSKKLKEEEPEIAKKFTKQTKISPTIRIEGF